MVRKLAFLLLFVIVVVGLALLLNARDPISSLNFSVSGVHPSTRPLPVPWSGMQSGQSYFPSIFLSSQPVPTTGAPLTQTGLCPAVYIVQKGDTAGSIALKCGTNLLALQAANPGVEDFNRIYPGQQLSLLAQPSVADFTLAEDYSFDGGQPGSTLYLRGEGFPALTDVRVGISLSTVGFRMLSQSKTDDLGRFFAVITIPPDASAGETSFLLVTAASSPPVQAVSDTFRIFP